jgi:lambda repressor-like predicted transcriptional regulator
MTTAQQLASQAKRAREATLHRDELIRRMRVEGSSLRSIAEAAGLTHPAIVKILRKAPVTAL